MSKSDLFATLQQAGLTREQRKNIATQIEQAGATGASTAATGAMAGAQGAATGTTWSLTAAMKGLGTVMKAHPILSFLAIAAIVVPLVVKAFDALTTSLEEQRQKLSDAKQLYDDTVSSLTDVESELEQVKARMAELNKLESPTLVEQNELKKLELTNEELEREVALLEREKQLRQAELEKQGVNTLKYKSGHYTGKEVSFEGVKVDTYAQMTDTEYLQYVMRTLPALQAQRAYALEQAEKALAEGNQAAYSIWKQEAVDLEHTYDTLLSEGGDVARTIQDTTSSIEGTTSESRKLKQEGEAAVNAWINFPVTLDGVATKLEEVKNTARSFSEWVSLLSNPIKALSEAQEEMANTGYLSADSIEALKEAGLDEYLVACEGGYKLTAGALNTYIEAQKTEYKTAITTAKEAANEVIKNEGKKQLAIGATTNEYIRQIKSMRSAELAALPEGLPGGGGLARQAIWDKYKGILADLETAQNNYDELLRAIGTTKRDGAGGGSADANKSEFEKLYAEKKHELELGRMTLKEFNDWLDGDEGYKSFFADRKTYASEWLKYEKEVFDNSMQLHEQEATNLDHTIEMLKLQGKSEQDILEAYRKKQILLETARDLVYDFLKAQGLSEEQIKSNSTFQELNKALLENPNEAKDFSQERVNQNVADFEHEINMLERVEGKENELIAKYREEQAYLVAVREEYRKTLVAADKTAEEIAKDDWFQELTEQIHDVNDAIDDVFQDVFDRISGDLNELLDLTKELIQHEKEEQIEALEDQKDAFSDLIDAKKEMLRLTREEQEYNDKVAKSTKDIAKLQSRIDALALDDSRQAALERGKLEEELAELQKELADTQNDHYISKTEEALDKEEEDYHDLMDSKIKDIEDFLDDNEAMTNAALQRLDDANETLFDQLESYAKHYTDTTGAELQNMWDTAMKAAEKYGSFTNSMTMFEEGDVQNEAQKIVAEMHHNGDMWAANPDPASREKYDRANLVLGDELEELLGVTVDRVNGTWYIGEGANRKKLYEVFGYHTGGVVGDTASVSPKADELFALLQRDEVVMSRNMVNNTFDFLAGLPKVMASAFHAPLSFASQAMRGAREYILHISAPLTMEGVLPKDEILSTIKQYPRKVAEAVAEQLQKL